MAEDKIAEPANGTIVPDPSDAKITFDAIRTAGATHKTTLSQHTAWAFRWACTCGERCVDTDFGTATFEGRHHEDVSRTMAVLTALAAAGRLLPTPEDRTEESWAVPTIPAAVMRVRTASGHVLQRLTTPGGEQLWEYGAGAFPEAEMIYRWGPVAWVAVDEGSGTA